MAIDAESVLEGLDYWEWLIDHPYLELIDVRLSAYASEETWGVIVEVISFNSHSFGHDAIENVLRRFGPATESMAIDFDAIYPTSDAPSGPLFGDIYEISKNTTSFMVRDVEVAVPREPAVYKNYGVDVSDVNVRLALQPWDMLRAVVPQNRELFLATDEELRRIVGDLPLILRLDEWHHLESEIEPVASEIVAFQQIAEVIATRDPSRYRPTLPPNTHWSQRTDEKL